MDISQCVGKNCRLRRESNAAVTTTARRIALRDQTLCRECAEELRSNLVELPRLHADYESALLPQHTPSHQRVRGCRQGGGPAIDEEALAARSAILGFLSAWSALVVDERGIAPPASRKPSGLAAFLLRNLSWLRTHPAVADLADEAHGLVARGHRSAHLRRDLRMDLGQCVHTDCTATMYSAAPTCEGGSLREVRCTAGHVWKPHQWLLLSRQIQQRSRTRAGRAGGAP
jgi:hypothetical protein